jgi:hypothetical protein
MTTERTRGRSVKKRTINNLPLWLGLGAVAVLIIGVIVFALISNSTAAANDEKVLQEGTNHVATTQRVTYTSNPPTSGDHWANPARLGFYKNDPPADEQLVHNMEHGAVIVWYDPDLLSEAEYNQLFAIYQKMVADEFRTILVAHPTLERKVALTAWGVRLYLDSVDEKAILGFQQRHKLLGPECKNKICPAQ